MTIDPRNKVASPSIPSVDFLSLLAPVLAGGGKAKPGELRAAIVAMRNALDTMIRAMDGEKVDVDGLAGAGAKIGGKELEAAQRLLMERLTNRE